MYSSPPPSTWTSLLSIERRNRWYHVEAPNGPGIVGFATIKMFHRNQTCEFQGDRTLENLEKIRGGDEYIT
jgi:hypothetical protein